MDRPRAVFAMHPGVVSTGLSGAEGFVAKLQDQFLLSPNRGAQMSLICATQPELTRGGYYHNTQGLMALAPADPARNAEAAQELWDTCMALT